jgi:hypothetical protein
VATTEQIIQRLGKLQSILLQSGLQQSNQPLYQVITQLIQAVRDSNIGVVEITGGSGGGPLSDKTFVTTSDELASLPNSSQIIAGDNLSFDTSVFGQLRLDVLLNFIINATFLTVDDESADFPNSRQLLAGTNITFDDTVANERTINASGGGSDVEWSVLANGDTTNPELIFAGGDVIMTHIP